MFFLAHHGPLPYGHPLEINQGEHTVVITGKLFIILGNVIYFCLTRAGVAKNTEKVNVTWTVNIFFNRGKRSK